MSIYGIQLRQVAVQESWLMRLHIWRHFRLALPYDWEMLQHSRNLSAGRCAFADRYSFRLEMSWRQVPGRPDLKRMIHDYRTMVAARDDGVDSKPIRYMDWHGFSIRCNGVSTTRYGAYFEKESCVLELVFVWPGKVDQALSRNVLDSVAIDPMRASGYRRWRAFGMDVLAPGNLPDMEVRAQPAFASLGFRQKSGIEEETYSRRGLVKEWLTVPVREWLQQQAPTDLEMSSASVYAQHQNNHRYEWLCAQSRAPAWRRWIGRQNHYAAVAWICPSDGRLYSAIRKSRGELATGVLYFCEGRFSCCAAVELRS